MTTPSKSLVPAPTADQRRAATGQFERANQVISTGNFDYGIRLLLSCCKLDPANLIYRQALRRTEKAKYRDNKRGHWLAWLTTWPGVSRAKRALRAADYVKVLEYGEIVLSRNPWNVPSQLAMAEAADCLGLLDMAIWNLEQARQMAARDLQVNRTLARLYEKRGNFTQAIALWELVRKIKPDDGEAQRKSKDLAASETIARGQYGDVVGSENKEGEDSPAGKAGTAAPGAGLGLKPRSHPEIQFGKGQAPQDRTQREIDGLRARIKDEPTNASVYLQLARLYRQADQREQAHQVLTEGLVPTANAFELAIELVDLEIEAMRKNLAVAEQQLKAKPDDADLRKLRSRLRKEINSRELEMHRQKADRFPSEMSHRLELGIRLLRSGQTDEAIKELQTARADLKLRWQVQMYLGHCFKARNNWTLAQRNFDESLQQLPPNEKAFRKEILYILAVGAAENGDLPKAVDCGNELANDDYSYRDISKLLDEWQAKMKQEKVSG